MWLALVRHNLPVQLHNLEIVLVPLLSFSNIIEVGTHFDPPLGCIIKHFQGFHDHLSSFVESRDSHWLAGLLKNDGSSLRILKNPGELCPM